MDGAIINAGGTIQLVGLAIIAIMALVFGIGIATSGSKGFSTAIIGAAGLLLGLYIVARPNDVMGIALRSVGGVQTLQMPSTANAPAVKPVAPAPAE